MIGQSLPNRSVQASSGDQFQVSVIDPVHAEQGVVDRIGPGGAAMDLMQGLMESAIQHDLMGSASPVIKVSCHDYRSIESNLVETLKQGASLVAAFPGQEPKMNTQQMDAFFGFDMEDPPFGKDPDTDIVVVVAHQRVSAENGIAVMTMEVPNILAIGMVLANLIRQVFRLGHGNPVPPISGVSAVFANNFLEQDQIGINGMDGIADGGEDY